MNSVFRIGRRKFQKKQRIGLQKDVFGLRFLNPVGLSTGGDRLLKSDKGLGFVVLDTSDKQPLAYAPQLSQRFSDTLLAAEIKTDIVHNFALFYDFADFFIITPDNMHGLDDPDVSDISDLLDLILQQRLCEEQYKPVLLRLSPGFTPDETRSLLDFCLLSRIDGFVLQNPGRLQQTLSYIQGRLPIMGSVQDGNPATALSFLKEGASLVEMNAKPCTLQKILRALESNI